MEPINCKIELIRKGAKLPSKATANSAGYDLYACLSVDNVSIQPGETYLVPLGFKTSFDPKYVAHIYARSGLATKRDLVPATAVSTIDADYRGEWFIGLRNCGNYIQTISDGERVAQLLFAHTFDVDFEPVDELDETERGAGGFGSSGTK